MPVQDNEKELNPVQENIPETNKEALVPVLNAIFENHAAQADDIDKKIAAREDKIAAQEAKIEKLSVRAEKLEAANAVLKTLADKIPAVSAVIASNEKKINSIRTELIPEKAKKIENHRTKINNLQHKKENVLNKAKKISAISGIIRSFMIPNSFERRKMFAENMESLNETSKNILKYKINKLQRRIDSISANYDKTSSSVEKLNLSRSLESVKEKLSVLNQKLERLENSEIPFSGLTGERADEVMIKASEIIENSDCRDIDDLAEEIITETADDFKQSEKARKEKTAENEAPAPETETRTEAVPEKLSPQEINIPEGRDTKINPEFYKNLPKEDRKIESFERNVAIKVMHKLNDKNIPFSAVSKDDKFTLTVDKKDQDRLSEIFKEAVEDAGKENPVKFSDLINPDYYLSLPRNNRAVSVEPQEAAEKIMKKLDEAGITYSAMKRDDNMSAVTVAKTDFDKFKEIEKEVRGTAVRDFVEKEFSHDKPEQKRSDKAQTAENKGKPFYFSRESMRHEAAAAASNRQAQNRENVNEKNNSRGARD